MTENWVREAENWARDVKEGHIWMTTREVAERLQVSESTIKKWRRERTGPIWFRLGKLIRYYSEDVDAWVKSSNTSKISD